MITAVEGQPVRIPHMRDELRPGDIGLYELRGGSFLRDLTPTLELDDGFVELGMLPNPATSPRRRVVGEIDSR